MNAFTRHIGSVRKKLLSVRRKKQDAEVKMPRALTSINGNSVSGIGQHEVIFLAGLSHGIPGVEFSINVNQGKSGWFEMIRMKFPNSTTSEGSNFSPDFLATPGMVSGLNSFSPVHKFCNSGGQGILSLMEAINHTGQNQQNARWNAG
jgi:hypothetical protein